MHHLGQRWLERGEGGEISPRPGSKWPLTEAKKNNTKGVDKLVAGGGYWGYVLNE